TGGPPLRPPEEPAPAPAPPSAAPAPPRDACERFSASLAESRRLADDGYLDRASKVLGRASSDCPSRSKEASPQLVAILVELGRWDEAARLARATLADAAAQETVSRIAALEQAGHPKGEALFESGRAEAAAGQHAKARRLFDRAIVELERTTGTTL